MAIVKKMSDRNSGAAAHLMINLDLYFQDVKSYYLLTREEE